MTPQCIRCGETENLHQHHWAPRAIFDDADEWGTVPLCPNHHALWHSTMRRFYTKPVHVESLPPLPPGPRPAAIGYDENGVEYERCMSLKQKTHEQHPDTKRSPNSSWQCVLLKGHEGLHKLKASAHQAAWADDSDELQTST